MKSIKSTAIEVVLAVMPVTVIVFLLQILLGISPIVMLQFLIGVIMVTVGFILFLLGVHFGLLEIGEATGAALPKLGKVWLVVFFGFLFGFVVTIAEPDVRILATQVEFVSQAVISKDMLIIVVALGVGIFVGLAMLRVILGISLQVLLISCYTLILVLALFTPAKFVSVALDAGGVTTGPITVPFIVSLGVGVASVLSGKKVSSDGFGFVALASIGPILAVLLLGVIYG